jgi:hypothetical protein
MTWIGFGGEIMSHRTVMGRWELELHKSAQAADIPADSELTGGYNVCSVLQPTIAGSVGDIVRYGVGSQDTVGVGQDEGSSRNHGDTASDQKLSRHHTLSH